MVDELDVMTLRLYYENQPQTIPPDSVFPEEAKQLIVAPLLLNQYNGDMEPS